MGNTRRGRSTALRGTGGFTLAETLIATAISGVILVGLYLVYDVNQITFIKGEQLADLQQNARIGMDRIVRELRLAGFDPQTAKIIPAPCATAIQVATATNIVFIADVDPSDPTPTTERVEYKHDPACAPNCVDDPPSMRREEWPSLPAGPSCTAPNWSTSGGAASFAERVTALRFTYYDASNICLGGAAASDCPAPPATVSGGNLGNIRRISITITTQDAQTGSTAQPFTLRAEVRPRNL